MRHIGASSSLIRCWEQLVFTEATLRAYPETSALAASIESLLATFSLLHGADLATRRGLIQARAGSAMADHALAEMLHELHSMAPGTDASGANRSVVGLPDASADAEVHDALEKRIATAQRLLADLTLPMIAEPIEHQIIRLDALIANGHELVAEGRAAAFAQREIELSISAWCDDVGAANRSLYEALRAIATSTGRAHSWVLSFFLEGRDLPDGIAEEPELPGP